jgi:REP element-mobilizing transposase RayT
LIKDICLEIEERYEIRFLEIWTDKDHIHLLIQWIPKLSPTEIIRIIKSITTKVIFKEYPKIKEKFWWGSFWSSWYYVNTVWQYWNEEVIRKYVQNQWKEK